MEMCDGILRRPSVLSAVGKRPGNSDGPDRVQPVRILDNPAFGCCGTFIAVLAEGNRIDCFTDPLFRFRTDSLPAQKTPGVGIVLRMEQLMVVRVMEQTPTGS